MITTESSSSEAEVLQDCLEVLDLAADDALEEIFDFELGIVAVNVGDKRIKTHNLLLYIEFVNCDSILFSTFLLMVYLHLIPTSVYLTFTVLYESGAVGLG